MELELIKIMFIKGVTKMRSQDDIYREQTFIFIFTSIQSQQLNN